MNGGTKRTLLRSKEYAGSKARKCRRVDPRSEGKEPGPTVRYRHDNSQFICLKKRERENGNTTRNLRYGTGNQTVSANTKIAPKIIRG